MPEQFSLECAFVDACLPDYWTGHPSPYLAVPVFKGMPIEALKEALKHELFAGVLFNADGNDVYDREAWELAALKAIAEITPLNPESTTCFNDLSEETLDECSDSIIAYFIFRNK